MHARPFAGRSARRALPNHVAYAATVTVGALFALSLIGVSIHLIRGGVDPIGLMALAPAEAAPEPVSQFLAEASAEAAPQMAPVPKSTPVIAAPVASAGGQPTFNGRPIYKVRSIDMLVTAYSPDARSCGKWADGKTASGYSVWTNGMKLVAADTRMLPFGSIVTVPGYNDGKPVPVLDRGGMIKGRRLDVLYPTHEIARQWGSQRLRVDVWAYAD